MTQQGGRQRFFREMAEVSKGSYNDNLIACSQVLNGPVTYATESEAFINLCNRLLNTSYTNAAECGQAVADAVGATNWVSVGYDELFGLIDSGLLELESGDGFILNEDGSFIAQE